MKRWCTLIGPAALVLAAIAACREEPQATDANRRTALTSAAIGSSFTGNLPYWTVMTPTIPFSSCGMQMRSKVPASSNV